MDLTKNEQQLVLNEVLTKFRHGRSYKKYRELEKGCEVWRRGYLRTYKNSSPASSRTREQKYFLGLIFRTIEQNAADCKDALFSNSPFFTIRPRGDDPVQTSIAEATQAVMEYNTTIPLDYSIQFLHAYRQACVFGVSYIAPFYDYRQMFKTNFYQAIDPQSGNKKVFIHDELEAVCDHPDFDVVYPTRVVCDPNAKFGKFAQTCDWRVIERIRPSVWYGDKQEVFGYSDKDLREIKAMPGSNSMDTTGPDNFSDNWDLCESKTFNELEYIGRILNPKLKNKFDPRRRYIITILNQVAIVRCDICTAPDGIGLHAMNLVPDLDGSHIGIGLADPAVDYQKAINEYYNLRMRGLMLAINPAYVVDQRALPDWRKMENHRPGQMFPYDGGVDARKIIQALNPTDVSGATWEQMVGFTQRDHDLTVGTSSSRLGSIEGEKRTATELSQVKEGADRRSNNLIYHAIRTGHKPLLLSMLRYTLQYWSTPRTLELIDTKTYLKQAVMVTPEDIRKAEVNLDIIDSTGTSIDQSMAFYAKLYEMSLTDPMINRTATLINMLKNSRIVNDPMQLISIMQPGMVQPPVEGGKGGEVVSRGDLKNIERGTNSDIQTSNRNFVPQKFR